MACEKLGIDRCRIVGLRYRLVDNDEISASLALKLDPAIAREFGKTGIATVMGAEGMVVDSEISGVDVTPTIAEADRRITQLQQELAQSEAKLRQAGLKADERADLEAQIAALRQDLRGSAETKADARKSLATTPMEFTYASGNLVPGFDGSSPLRDAIRTAWDSLVTMLGIIIIAIATVLPWAALGGLGYLAFRAARRRWPLSTPVDSPVV